MKNFLLLFCFLAFGFKMNAQHYNKFCNEAFAFCVDIPGNYVLKGEAKTGVGQYFTAKDGSTITVYGTSNGQQESVKQRFEREQKMLTSDTSVANTTQLPIIEKAEMLENSFIIVYQNQNSSNLTFRKLENNSWKNIELQYPTAKAKKFEEIANRLLSSLR